MAENIPQKTFLFLDGYSILCLLPGLHTNFISPRAKVGRLVEELRGDTSRSDCIFKFQFMELFAAVGGLGSLVLRELAKIFDF